MMQINHLRKRVGTIAVCTMLILMNIMLCGAWFAKPDVILDTEKNVLYQCTSADVVINAFESDPKNAKVKYNENPYLISGTIISKKKNNKELSLGIDKQTKRVITCKTTDKAALENFKEGDQISLFGKLNVGLVKYSLSMNIDNVMSSPNTSYADDTYILLDGTVVNKTSLVKRTFAESGFIFFIPSGWKAIEHDIESEKLGNMPGYQYTLNKIGKKRAKAESLFICYFDKTKMVDINDQKENDLIEKAIIKDILGKDTLKEFPLKTITTYYGASYKYYRDTYKQALGEKYQVEFIFQEVDNAILVYVYVYQEPNNISDVMTVLRFVEDTNKK
ncbi:hypothetical protein SAMN04487770_1288 [Butyrivibrio sp. ob235]|uniref:hypothetical protein n=1 Tax=Butyrivibrio sp. ob235 TaxID=1761780 RepID=UPI0008D68DA2|nr:hypothetical protein [Butyrivibrio sp. ob235]SEM18448.1 hypothetical protein SAMN04487770_1288 [Butyrivibrio sp. ob235]